MRKLPKVAIIGASGFIGSGLVRRFAAEGWRVTGVSRKPRTAGEMVREWRLLEDLDLSAVDAVVNLSGEPVDRRWTEARKREFHRSRVDVTRKLVDAIADLPEDRRPKVLANASAVGIYGDRGDETLDENALPGEGDLALLCQEWEQAALRAESLGVRVVMPRIGIVLGRRGAAFQKLRMVFNAGLGGRLGSGRQWMPWVHVADVRGAIFHAVIHDGIRGAFNLTAPCPERNRDFTAKLAKALRRPAVLPVPGFALKLALGGFAGVLLAGQRTQASALERSGYRFRFPRLEDALRDLVG